VADATAAFVLGRAAAFGQAPPFCLIAVFALLSHVHLDGFGHGVGAGGDPVITEAGRFMTVTNSGIHPDLIDWEVADELV
jgi:hypothetical protein